MVRSLDEKSCCNQNQGERGVANWSQEKEETQSLGLGHRFGEELTARDAGWAPGMLWSQLGVYALTHLKTGSRGTCLWGPTPLAALMGEIHSRETETIYSTKNWAVSGPEDQQRWVGRMAGAASELKSITVPDSQGKGSTKAVFIHRISRASSKSLFNCGYFISRKMFDSGWPF